MEFVESFMKFSFQDDDIFRIEEDELVQSTDGIKACECVVLISENVALIEAKSSAPKIDNEEKFQQFIPNRSLEKASCNFLMTAIRKMTLYMLNL